MVSRSSAIGPAERKTAVIAIRMGGWMMMAAACLGSPSEKTPATAPATTTAPSGRKLVVLIEGQCFDTLGVGVEEVKVVAHLKTQDGKIEYVNTATTDKMGDFAILAGERRKGTAVVTLTKWGFKEATREVELTLGDDLPPFVDVGLEGAVIAFGIVTDAGSGAPVADAAVKIETGGNQWSSRTDADGKFRVAGLRPGPGMVIVESPGYGRSRLPVEDFADFGELVVLLSSERVVRFKIANDLGEPVARATVGVVAPATGDMLSGVTDEAGEVVFRGMNADITELRIHLEHAGHVCSAGYDRVVTLDEEEMESSRGLIMIRAATLTGKVTDAQTADPLGGARVIAGEGMPDSLPATWTDFEGEYRLEGVPPGRSPVTVYRAGNAPALKEVSLAAGEQTQVDFALGPSGEVHGLVVDGEGKPVPRAYVQITQWRSWNTLGLQALTDDEGTFLLYNAPADPFTIAISSRGHADLRSQTVQAREEPYKFTLPARSRDKEGDGFLATLKAGDAAPPLDLLTLDGKRLTSDSLKGKWVLLDFWATWCGPCVAELPSMKAVWEAHGRRDDFRMIGISLDDSAAALQAFVDKSGLHWTHVFGDAGGARKTAEAYGAHAIPFIVLISPEGNVAAVDLRGPDMAETIGTRMNAPKDVDKPEEKTPPPATTRPAGGES